MRLTDRYFGRQLKSLYEFNVFLANMKGLLHFSGYLAKIGIPFLALAITSCNALKKVGVQQVLIHKNTITVDSVKVVNENIESLILQKKNAALLGYPLRLNLYNLAKENPDSTFNAWLYKNEKRKPRLDKFLSEKQTLRLGQSFLVKGLSTWLKDIGEPPAILDTALTRKSLERLSKYYSSKGYFNNTTTFAIDSLNKKQRVAVNYQITLGEPFVLDSVYHQIASKAIDSLYGLHKAQSYVRSGNTFDIDHFENERDRLTTVFRNNGIWNFQESAIKYNIVADTSRSGTDKKMDIELTIENLKKRNLNAVTTEEYKVFTFDKINIYMDFFDESKGNLKFERFDDYTIYFRDKLRFKPNTLTDAIFFEKDSVYSELNRIRTLRQLTNLNVFKYPSINFEEDSTRTYLNTNIYLSPKPKYSFRTNLDATHSSLQWLGIAFSPSLQARNLFKGAENLSLSGRFNVGSSRDQSIADNRFFNLWEIGADLSLDIPRIWLPIINTKKLIPNYMLPRTNIKLGTTVQQNIGLDKQTFNTVLGYNWAPSDFTRHNVELLNVQFVRNINKVRFFNVYRNTYDRLDEIADSYETVLPNLYQTVDETGQLRLKFPAEGETDNANDFIDAILNEEVTFVNENGRDDKLEVDRIKERRDRLVQDNLIFTTNYTFNKNNRQGATDNDFYQFRLKVESAGNLLSAISYLIPFNETNGNLVVFDVPYSQYIKTEFEYVKYWDLSRSNVLAMRTFAGIAVPYGNSDNIPFLRSYFAGGSNDNRAWRPYSLGPGKTSAANDFNEANLKLAFNLEYRFPVAGNFKGALFADAGNIWNVFDNIDDPDATFNGLSSLKDIALGSGFGIRYDFTYFVIRGDLAFKTYNPAEESSKRWFRDYNFANSVLQIGINYPF